VLAIEPRSHHGGDEELGAIAEVELERFHTRNRVHHVRIGAGIGHRQHERLLVLQLEVLIGELLAEDGATSGALGILVSFWTTTESIVACVSYIVTGKVSSLKHELRNDTMEGAARVATDRVALGELPEVLRSLGDNIVEELELDASTAL
jgi:hypothetical protein